MRERWRAFLEEWLPWYHPAVEKRRDRHTEAIRRRSIQTRIRSEHIIADYRAAMRLSTKAGELVVDEARRARDDRE